MWDKYYHYVRTEEQWSSNFRLETTLCIVFTFDVKMVLHYGVFHNGLISSDSVLAKSIIWKYARFLVCFPFIHTLLFSSFSSISLKGRGCNIQLDSFHSGYIYYVTGFVNSNISSYILHPFPSSCRIHEHFFVPRTDYFTETRGDPARHRLF